MFVRVLQHRRLDVSIAAALFAVALAVSSWYVPFFIRSGGKPWFYQEQFAPAVMEACGRGYVNPDLNAVPALQAFLERSTDAFDCSQIGNPPTVDLASMQKAFRYLMMSVSGVWMADGEVSWSGLTPFYALLYGTTTVLAYAILRQGMGPWLAGLGGLAIALSTLHLNNLPHLRDYGKAPFVLAIVLVALRLVRGPATRARVLKLAVIGGVLSGIGIGFRNDLLVAIPAMTATIAVFLPLGWRQGLGLRLAAVVLYLATTIAAMSPMLSIYQTGGGNSTQHLVLLGLADEFTEELGIDNSGLYRWVFHYRDELAQVLISDYATRRLGEQGLLPMYGPGYDRAATQLLGEIAARHPADMLVRVYASSLNILEAPYSAMTTVLMPPAFVGEPLIKFSRARTWVLRRLTPLWPWMYAIALVSLTLWDLRLGIFSALFVLYLSGYPALQFQERHIFHLEFIGWMAFGIAMTIVGRLIRAGVDRDRWRQLWQEWRPAAGWPRALAGTAVVWVTIIVLLLVPLWLLRQRQQGDVREELTAIVNAPREAVATASVPAQPGIVRLETPSLNRPDDRGTVHTEYLVAEFGGNRCETLKLDLTFRYQADDPSFDFTRTLAVQPPLVDRPVQIFMAVYSRREDPQRRDKGAFAFRGLELPESAIGCLTGLSRVVDPKALPLLPDLHLRPYWEDATLYATIAGVESRTPPVDFPQVHTFPPDLAVKRSLLMQTPQPFHEREITKVSPTFRMSPEEWRVAGVGGVGGRGPFLYLVEFGARPLKKGSYVIAQGTIEKGGISYGLANEEAWVAQVPVTHAGPFAVVVQVPEDGLYKIVLANNLIRTSLDNRLRVTRAGVLPAPAAP